MQQTKPYEFGDSVTHMDIPASLVNAMLRDGPGLPVRLKPEDIEIPDKLKGTKVSAKELDMALRLIEDMADEWKPEKYHDTYHEDLLKRIEAKVKAGQTEEITAPEKEERAAKGAEVIDLMSLLKKSVEGGKKPKRAARKRRAA